MNQAEKRALENNLIAMGLSGIEDPDLHQVFARIVEDFPGDKHWFYRGMLNECDPESRRDMYYSLKGKFTHFVPLPLESYLAQIAEEAGRLRSQGMIRVEGPRPHAVEIRGEHYVPVPDEAATHRAIRLTCSKCTKMRVFVGETMVEAMIKARAKGWVNDAGKEICPRCPAVRPTGNA